MPQACAGRLQAVTVIDLGGNSCMRRNVLGERRRRAPTSMLRNSKTAKEIDTQEGRVRRASISRGFQTVFLQIPRGSRAMPCGLVGLHPWLPEQLNCASSMTASHARKVLCKDVLLLGDLNCSCERLQIVVKDKNLILFDEQKTRAGAS